MKPRTTSQAGNVLYLTVIVLIILAALAVAISRAVTSSMQSQRQAANHLERLYIAESGIQQALLSIQMGGDGILGSAIDPIPLGSGHYWTTAAPFIDPANHESLDDAVCVNPSETSVADSGILRIVCWGRVRGRARAVEVVFRSSSPYEYAVYAGNDSEDGAYALTLSGTGTRADRILGDVYSGQDLRVTGDAEIRGQIQVRGIAEGVADAQEGQVRQGQSLEGLRDPARADVDVSAEFDRYGSRKRSDVPPPSPAHMFRRNPEEYSDVVLATAKNDYFLGDRNENPTAYGKNAFKRLAKRAKRLKNARNGSSGASESEEGASGATEPLTFPVLGDGTKLTYYVDGNLWIQSPSGLPFFIPSNGTSGNQITIVVKGNIYVNQGIVLESLEKDGLALVAIQDEDVDGSGNIFLGDPLTTMSADVAAFLFAECCIFDNASPDSELSVRGSLHAGDKVALLDDAEGDDSGRFTVYFDPRLKSGDLVLPGLPDGGNAVGHSILLWREISEEH